MGVPSAVRWVGNLPVFDFSVTPPAIRPHQLVMGYMTALQSIYLSDKAQFCTQPFGQNFFSATGTATNSFPQIFTNSTAGGMDLAELNEYIKIEPFDTATGALVAGCPDVDIRPPRANEANLASDIQSPSLLVHPNDPSVQVFTLPTSVQFDRGFLVTSTVTFKDRAGRQRECKAQKRFQYGLQPQNSTVITVLDAEGVLDDSDDPEELNTSLNTTELTNPPDQDGEFDATPPHYLRCDDSSYSRNLNIRLRNVRAGSLLMCRNMSVQRSSDATAVTGGEMITNTYNQTQTFYSTEIAQQPYYWSYPQAIAGMYLPSGTYYCKTAEGCPELPRFSYGSLAPGGAASVEYNGSRGVRYYFPKTHSLEVAYKWEACERVQICGVDPTTAGLAKASGNLVSGYHLRYANLPQGCDVHLQIAEVDAAYNIATSEVREYMEERQPGNKVCFNGTPALSASYPANAWFFACTTGTNPAGFRDCDDYDTSGTGCCEDYPFYREYRPTMPDVHTPGVDCTLPWGGSLSDGSSATAWLASVSSSCTSESRLCDNGTLIGTYQYASCTPPPPTSCTLPWGGVIANGGSATAYLAATGASCTSETRTCTDGVLSGSYNYETCTTAASCTLPWGETLAHGDSVTAYNVASTGGKCSRYGSSPCNGTTASPCSCTAGSAPCLSEMRTCSNGSLSGSYQYKTCTSLYSCNWYGTIITSGTSVTAYKLNSLSGCAAGKTCWNVRDSLYSPPYSACSTGAPTFYSNYRCAATNPSPTCVGGYYHGPYVYSYRLGTAASLSSCSYHVPSDCSSMSRTCNDGAMDGDSEFNETSCQ